MIIFLMIFSDDIIINKNDTYDLYDLRKEDIFKNKKLLRKEKIEKNKEYLYIKRQMNLY